MAEDLRKLAAARALTGELAVRFKRGEAVMAQVAMCKNTATDMCSFVVDQAVQLHGGAGYMAEYAVERFYRDVRLFRIYEGTTQIQQVLIARNMIRDAAAA